MTSASTTLLYQIYHEIWSSSCEVIAYAWKPICAHISDCLQALSIKFVKFYRLNQCQYKCRWSLFLPYCPFKISSRNFVWYIDMFLFIASNKETDSKGKASRLAWNWIREKRVCHPFLDGAWQHSKATRVYWERQRICLIYGILQRCKLLWRKTCQRKSKDYQAVACSAFEVAQATSHF